VDRGSLDRFDMNTTSSSSTSIHAMHIPTLIQLARASQQDFNSVA
jgi:hypothetical protein